MKATIIFSLQIDYYIQTKIQSIKISTKVIDPDNAKYLEELVLKAVSEAIAKSQKLAAKQLGGLTGGLKIPGLM